MKFTDSDRTLTSYRPRFAEIAMSNIHTSLHTFPWRHEWMIGAEPSPALCLADGEIGGIFRQRPSLVPCLKYVTWSQTQPPLVMPPITHRAPHTMIVGCPPLPKRLPKLLHIQEVQHREIDDNMNCDQPVIRISAKRI